MSIPDFNSDASPYDPSMPVNHNDDDAEILDNLIEQDATPPEPVEIPRVDIPPVPKVEIPPLQVMRTRTIILASNVPILLASANPWRKSISVDFSYSSALATLRVGPTSTDVMSLSTSAANTYAAYGDLEFSYNGELWAFITGLPQETQHTAAITEIIEGAPAK